MKFQILILSSTLFIILRQFIEEFDNYKKL